MVTSSFLFADIYRKAFLTMVITDEVRDLFKLVRHLLGAPIRAIQLEDEQLCDLLKVAIGDYTEKVQNWCIMVNWLNIGGQKTIQFQNPMDLAYAMTVRNMDMSKDVSYWFSREVGLQQRGSYELKKDYFVIEEGKQVYMIPAGREINRVMWITPSTTKVAMYGNMGVMDGGIGGGFFQIPNMSYGIGVNGFYIGSVYDTALLAADLKTKNQFMRGDLAYKVTAGPNGTHLVHLMSTPGSPTNFKGLGLDDTWSWNKYKGCYCWYTYYDVGTDPDDIEACRLENRDDVIITPDQVPFNEIRYELMNNPTQQIIRQLLVAEAKILLGIVRGTNSGKVSIPEAELTLDYNMLIEQGKAEKERVLNDLKERLEAMCPWNLLQKQKDMLDALKGVLDYKPLSMYWR